MSLGNRSGNRQRLAKLQMSMVRKLSVEIAKVKKKRLLPGSAMPVAPEYCQCRQPWLSVNSTIRTTPASVRAKMKMIAAPAAAREIKSDPAR